MVQDLLFTHSGPYGPSVGCAYSAYTRHSRAVVTVRHLFTYHNSEIVRSQVVEFVTRFLTGARSISHACYRAMHRMMKVVHNFCETPLDQEEIQYVTRQFIRLIGAESELECILYDDSDKQIVIDEAAVLILRFVPKTRGASIRY